MPQPHPWSERYPKGVFLQLGRLTTRVSKFVILNTYIYSNSSGVCASHLSDDVYDKVTVSSITGVTLSADLGVFREIAPTRGGAISRNPQIRTESDASYTTAINVRETLQKFN